jgi:hypothetical protein
VLLSVGPVDLPGGRHEGEDDATLAAVYWANRPWLLSPDRNRPGRRPWAWWAFEVTDASMLEASEAERLHFLRKHDLLRPDEVVALDALTRANGQAA